MKFKKILVVGISKSSLDEENWDKIGAFLKGKPQNVVNP